MGKKSISSADFSTRLDLSLEPQYVDINGKQFSTELSEEELFQYSLQYPVLNDLLSFNENAYFYIIEFHIDELYRLMS